MAWVKGCEVLMAPVYTRGIRDLLRDKKLVVDATSGPQCGPTRPPACRTHRDASRRSAESGPCPAGCHLGSGAIEALRGPPAPTVPAVPPGSVATCSAAICREPGTARIGFGSRCTSGQSAMQHPHCEYRLWSSVSASSCHNGGLSQRPSAVAKCSSGQSHNSVMLGASHPGPTCLACVTVGTAT